MKNGETVENLLFLTEKLKKDLESGAKIPVSDYSIGQACIYLYEETGNDDYRKLADSLHERLIGFLDTDESSISLSGIKDMCFYVIILYTSPGVFVSPLKAFLIRSSRLI